MSIELLSHNIQREREIINSVSYLDNIISSGSLGNIETGSIKRNIKNLLSQLRIINDAIPALLETLSFYKNLSVVESSKSNKQEDISLLKIKYNLDEKEKAERIVAVKKKDEKDFLKNIAQESQTKKLIDLLNPRSSLVGLSNKIFREFSDNLIKKGYFDLIKTDLRKISSSMILETYIPLMFFSTCMAFIFGILFSAALILFKIPIGISLSLVFIIPFIIILTFLLYPSSRRKTLEKGINQELPFLVLHIAAISTSGIEPSKIFNILVTSKEYPFAQREVKKLTNYINFYGLDMVSALKNSAKNSPSERLALLFEGLATTITSGGELTTFLDKHSESLLFDYKLEREKYTRIAETFMNVYISIVIAAPMIMMILFVLIGLTGFLAGGMTPAVIGLLTVLAISIINIFFLVLLNLKQPKF